MPGISKETGRSPCGQISGYSMIMLEELAVKLIFTAREASERLGRWGLSIRLPPADTGVQASAQSTTWPLVRTACSPSLRNNKYLHYRTR